MTKKSQTCGEPGCQAPALRALTRPLCSYHWAAVVWGKSWADECHPERSKAQQAPEVRP